MNISENFMYFILKAKYTLSLKFVPAQVHGINNWSTMQSGTTINFEMLQKNFCTLNFEYEAFTYNSVNDNTKWYPGNEREYYDGSNNIIFQEFPKFTRIAQSVEEILQTRDYILSCFLTFLLKYTQSRNYIRCGLSRVIQLIRRSV